MCGIVGAVRSPGAPPREGAAERARILGSICHRGPDAQGEFADDDVWFGHARLSIIDLTEAGAQPMATADGRYVICYNGEVYNFRELAAELRLEDLRSHSDTEVVLRAFAILGPDAFVRLNGMFALAIYDRVARRVWLARDRLGIKPLYARFDARGLTFASEIKALHAASETAPRCDTGALHEWLYYGTTLGERTVYQGISKVLPGHWLELDLASFAWSTRAYWSPHEYGGIGRPRHARTELVATTRALLDQAVRRQLVADVPVGVFLSGGVDSSAITAFASRHYAGTLSTYSVGFDFDRGMNELPQAREIARQFGTDHHELRVGGVDVADVVVKLIDHHDLPFSDAANIPLYLLSQRLGGKTKVVLQGDGGDELFGGYSRYMTLSHYRLARLLAAIGRVVNPLTPQGPAHFRRRRYFNALAPREFAEVMALLMTEEDPRDRPERVFGPALRPALTAADPFRRYRECQRSVEAEDRVNQMLLVDAMVILPDIFLEKVDRSTMAAGLEVRVPFLDNDLVDYCFRLRGGDKVRSGRRKWLLKAALEGVIPDRVLYGPKRGFGVPYGHWLRGPLRELFLDALNTIERQHPDVLDGAVIRAMYREHECRARDRSFLLWKLLNFMIWANRTGTALRPAEPGA